MIIQLSKSLKMLSFDISERTLFRQELASHGPDPRVYHLKMILSTCVGTSSRTSKYWGQLIFTVMERLFLLRCSSVRTTELILLCPLFGVSLREVLLCILQVIMPYKNQWSGHVNQGGKCPRVAIHVYSAHQTYVVPCASVCLVLSQ